MNYRHAFHAGNFADVVKHATLARIVAYLKEKPAAFRVIDTHAGAGLYDLAGPEASRTGEWREGIGKLAAADARACGARPARALSRRGRVVQSAAGALQVYPGSPALVRAWLRRQDRMIACEREPDAARALAGRMRGDSRVKAVAIDGYTALNAYVPPKERRGLVLIDPPFEQPDEFDRLGAGAVRQRTANGRPASICSGIRSRMRARPRPSRAASRGLAIARDPARRTRARRRAATSGCAARGLIVVNPPWTLHDELGVLLPALAAGARRRGRDGDAARLAGGRKVRWCGGAPLSSAPG